ncbi:MAG: hypothetical protein ABI194_06380 [Gemmatimonadaceae bacterium]
MSWTGTAFAQSAVPALGDYVRSTAQLSTGQIDDARNGRVVTKFLRTELGRDVAVFGMVGIHVTRAAYIAHLRNVKSLISTRAQRFGIIGDPATSADLRGMAMAPSEWPALESCRVNHCDFKLPASSMEQFAHAVNWSGPNAQSEVDSIMRSNMEALVTAYRARGNAAMPRYDDTNSILAGDAFGALLGQSQFLSQYAPAFRNFLANYPSDRPEGATDVMYWSMDQITHLRPTLTVNQLLVYVPATGIPFVARKQIYADHYFEASLAVTAVFDAPDLEGGPGIYLVSVRRYRFDSLPGGFLNIRGRARNALQKQLSSDLEKERKSSEARVAS